MRFYRGPVITLCLAVSLILVALVLDRVAGETGREIALVCGVAAFYFLLPVAVLWWLLAVIRHIRSRRH